jgi:hypothetical protein
MSNPGAFAAAGAEEQEGGEPPPLLPAPVWSSVSWGEGGVCCRSRSSRSRQPGPAASGCDGRKARWFPATESSCEPNSVEPLSISTRPRVLLKGYGAPGRRGRDVRRFRGSTPPARRPAASRSGLRPFRLTLDHEHLATAAGIEMARAASRRSATAGPMRRSRSRPCRCSGSFSVP